MTIQETIKTINDKHERTIKKILDKNSYHFSSYQEATEDEDRNEGFDATYNINSVTIAIRVRKYKFAKKYMDITIRSKTAKGNPTEYDKMKQGKGDYYLYCWENEAETKIMCYVLFDIKKFVATGEIDKPILLNKENGDGTMFNVYSIVQLMQAGVIKIFENLDKC